MTTLIQITMFAIAFVVTDKILRSRKEMLFEEVQHRECSGLTKEEEEYYFGDGGQ